MTWQVMKLKAAMLPLAHTTASTIVLATKMHPMTRLHGNTATGATTGTTTQ